MEKSSSTRAILVICLLSSRFLYCAEVPSPNQIRSAALWRTIAAEPLDRNVYTRHPAPSQSLFIASNEAIRDSTLDQSIAMPPCESLAYMDRNSHTGPLAIRNSDLLVLLSQRNLIKTKTAMRQMVPLSNFASSQTVRARGGRSSKRWPYNPLGPHSKIQCRPR